MSNSKRDFFATVKSEGVVLPISILQKIISLDGDIEGIKPQDYHLAPTERINEAISRSWQRTVVLWRRFNEQISKVPNNDPKTSITRERWLLPLFQELGYGNLPLSKGFEIEGKSYPISHVGDNVVIHLIGYNIKLDERTAGVAGAAKMSPHSLVQLFLNSSKDYLWGIVSNGHILRLLRDDISITRQSYIEFDLKGMFDGEVYSDFVILWLLCHQSRFEGIKPEECFIEKWSKTSQETGARLLEQLREGVTQAICLLGTGFIKNTDNKELRDKLTVGTVDGQVYYRQLLRLVYRMIFLFVAEDRNVLLSPNCSIESKENYVRYYSMSRIRNIAKNTDGNNHCDLYECLKVVMNGLESRKGIEEIAIPPLGSAMWSDGFVGCLSQSKIDNTYFIKSVKVLSFTIEKNYRMPVNFKNLGAEELGSVYESLLELSPNIDLTSGSFTLNVVSGSERKTTGSYYTPSSLINCLLDSALEPVIAKARRGENPEQAILEIKLCDPACGSGHFLVAAAHRLAKHLSAVRTGDEESSPEARRHALREIISRCIYGVDRNEMAVELCRINLWLESLEPGKPLAFLEQHIQCGNSLMGATSEMIKKGIPEEAFDPIEGDERSVCSKYKRENSREKEYNIGYTLLDDADYSRRVILSLSQVAATVEGTEDDSFENLERKRKMYEDLINSEYYSGLRLKSDIWCSAFVCRKTQNDLVITENVLKAAQRGLDHVKKDIQDTVNKLNAQYQFFHWELAFPEIFLSEKKQGFDVVLGNPPWERIKLQESEWFAQRIPEIANAQNASERKRMIATLKEENPYVYEAFLSDKRISEGESHYIRNSGTYPLCGRGDINTYSVFTELMRRLKSNDGYVGCVIPSGIATDDTTKLFFQSLVDTNSLVSLYDFENRQGIFQGVHRSFKFCLLTIAESSKRIKRKAEFMFFGQTIDELKDFNKRFHLTSDEIALINPNTHTCPVFRNNRDARIAIDVYRRMTVLMDEKRSNVEGWNVEFLRMFDMSNDSHLFKQRTRLITEGYALNGNSFSKYNDRWVPLYEAKMFHQYDHRFGTYEGVAEDTVNTSLPSPTLLQYKNPEYAVLPRYWVNYRSVAPYLYDAPRELTDAYFNDRHEEVRDMMRLWISGYYYNRQMSIYNRKCINKELNSIIVINTEKAKKTELQYPLDRQEVELLEETEDLWESLGELIERRRYRYLISFRGIARCTDERTFISSLLPSVAVGNSAPLIVYKRTDASRMFLLLANLNSFVFDFIVRLKAGGSNMNFFIVKQLPVIEPSKYSNVKINGEIAVDWLKDRIGRLVCTTYEMQGFADDIGYEAPEYTWDEAERFKTRCGIDAAYFKMYGISRDDVEYIMDTFPIVKLKDIQQYGFYRTKDTILGIYDGMVVDEIN